MLQGRTAGGHGLLEATPRIYHVTPDIPDRRRATNTSRSGPSPADSLNESQLAAGRDHPFGVGRHRHPDIETASLEAAARHIMVRVLATLPLIVHKGSEAAVGEGARRLLQSPKSISAHTEAAHAGRATFPPLTPSTAPPDTSVSACLAAARSVRPNGSPLLDRQRSIHAALVMAR